VLREQGNRAVRIQLQHTGVELDLHRIQAHRRNSGRRYAPKFFV
jgi:hypothetical protein